MAGPSTELYCTIPTSHSRSTQQFLQQDLFKLLAPDQALAIPSFFQVEGSIRFSLGDTGFNWT